MSATATLVPDLRPAWGNTGWPERAVVTSIVLACGGVSWYLLSFWRESPELSHGYFAPFCSLALLWQSRREANLIARWPAGAAAGIAGAIVLAGIGLAALAALAALAQGTFHSQTGFLVGLLTASFIASGALTLASRPGGWAHFNGTSLCAAALWCFAVPLPAGTLARFTLFLQDLITAGSLRAVHLIGLPARREGNVIELANRVFVGVEEACSGIRSLTACLFAGVVLGGFMLRGLPRRIVILFAAGAMAVLANFVRSVALCLMAARGVEIRGFWHDATAYVVLGVTALVLFGGCLLLAPKTEALAPTSAAARSRALPSAHALFAGFTAMLAFFVLYKIAPAPAREIPPPDLQALMVIDSPGWARRSDESIFAYSTALNTAHLRQESYFRAGTQLTFYVAFWPTRQSTLGSVALHTPEICLPTGGWNPQPLPPSIARYPLAEPSRFAFEKEAYPQHVWFWHFFGGRLVHDLPGLYPWQLGRALLEGPVNARAPQWVVRISSNRPLESLLDEPLVQEFFARLRAAGLAGQGPAA